MKKIVVMIGEANFTADFDSIKVDAGEGKLYCSRAIEAEEKPYWVGCSLQHGFDIEFSDDNLDVIVIIDIENVKSISNTKGGGEV